MRSTRNALLSKGSSSPNNRPTDGHTDRPTDGQTARWTNQPTNQSNENNHVIALRGSYATSVGAADNHDDVRQRVLPRGTTTNCKSSAELPILNTTTQELKGGLASRPTAVCPSPLSLPRLFCNSAKKQRWIFSRTTNVSTNQQIADTRVIHKNERQAGRDAGTQCGRRMEKARFR